MTEAERSWEGRPVGALAASLRAPGWSLTLIGCGSPMFLEREGSLGLPARVCVGPASLPLRHLRVGAQAEVLCAS